MLELSETVLRNGYTIFISKNPNTKKLQGSYIKSFRDGLHPYELPPKEVMPLHHLANINEYLSEGAILQVHQDGYQVNGIIGRKKTEGPYCETEYLEIIQQQVDLNYQEMLAYLDMGLASTKEQTAVQAVEYIKLYKGVNRYE